MNIDITGRHVEITPALREFAASKLTKLTRLLDEPLDVHIVLTVEKHRQTAEILVSARNAKLGGTEQTDDLYASIHEVVEKLERQALKHKERGRAHKHRPTHRDPAVAAAIQAHDSEAVRGDSGPPPSDGPRLVRSASYRLKPLSPEDALIELEARGEELLVFRNADTERVAVIHRRADGDFGLVEPDF